jgi:hypothetical protein
MSIDENVLRLKRDFDAVYEAGKAAGGGDEYIYIPYLTRFGVGDLNTFNKAKVELNVPKVTSYTQMLMQSETKNTTVEHITINGLQDGTIQDCEELFRANDDYKLKHITLNCSFRSCVWHRYLFYRLRALEVIDGMPLDFSGANGTNTTYLDYAFSYCDALRELRVVPLSVRQPMYFSYSPNLSDETIQSIINGLADLTGQTAKTLTLHANAKAKLTEEQLATITNKNWNLA